MDINIILLGSFCFLFGISIGTFIGIHYHRQGVEDGLKFHGLMSEHDKL